MRVEKNRQKRVEAFDKKSEPMSNPQQEYIKHRVQTASPVELIRILYQAALQAMDEAVRALHSGDILARGRAVTKIIEILSELRIALRYDVQPEYCNTLAGLYGYMQTQVIRAHSEQSESPFQEVSRLLQTLLEGWNGAIDKLNDKLNDELNGPPEDTHPLDKPTPAVSELNPYSAEEATALPSVRSWQL